MIGKLLLFAGMIVGSFGKIVDCSSSSSKFHIQSLSFVPEIPTRNENVTITMIFDASEVVESGKVEYSVSLNGLPVYSESDELCSQTTCPINVGTHNETSVFTWPDVSGKVVSKTVWKDSSGSELLCFQTSSTTSYSKSSVHNLRGSNKNQLSTVVFKNNTQSFSTCLVPYYNQTLHSENNIKDIIHYHNEL
jgi:hypothetical protein